LAKANESFSDGGVAVRVIFHRLSDDVSDLVEAAVVHALHGVEDAALDGFQAVIQVGDGALEDDVAGVVEEPVTIHFAHVIEPERGAVVAEGGGGEGGVGLGAAGDDFERGGV
jgi:hypothetical protein